jgi:hypothetical protein
MTLFLIRRDPYFSTFHHSTSLFPFPLGSSVNDVMQFSTLNIFVTSCLTSGVNFIKVLRAAFMLIHKFSIFSNFVRFEKT